MESTIGLRFSTLPNQYSICMPSGFHAARATKPHLSFSHSSLSLPQSSRNRPIEHIRGPITCMLDGSLPPTYYRVDKGRASMASASPFLHNIGSGRWTNHKGNAAQIDGIPWQEYHCQGRQVLIIILRNAIVAVRNHGLSPNVIVKLPMGHYELELKNCENSPAWLLNESYASQLMEVAKKLKESRQYDLAVEILELNEPKVSEDPKLLTKCKWK
ncbi:hypothetical protein CK203_018331 [Vitis vinifera]|uniref:Uncharacterized protein n=1 Tax=Vitis vinifera TaxID=29760 RepID=A0A438JPN4_VITVI|nr:hypothetical protein CK203_018331 [Vitis vinifera]